MKRPHNPRTPGTSPGRSPTRNTLIRAAWNYAADAMVLSDAAGIVVAANEAYYTLYGYSADEVLGHSFAIIFPPEYRQQAQAQYEATFSGPVLESTYESVIQRKDGTTRTVESRAEFITEHGRRTALLSIIRDISARKTLETELAELLKREQAALAEAQQAIKVRDAFLSIASHELRTPLTTLLGNAQLLQRRVAKAGALPERDAHTLDVIVGQAHRLNQMMSDLLDLSLVEERQLHIERTAFDINALARRVAETTAASGQHTLSYYGPAEPLLVAGDPNRIEQVLQNLIQNAVKYSPHGGEIVICAEQRASRAVIAVSDQGIGIPAEALPQLFQRFYRAPNAGHIRGTGIGLYVVKEIISLHNGTITAASAEGHGSTFTIELPLQQ